MFCRNLGDCPVKNESEGITESHNIYIIFLYKNDNMSKIDTVKGTLRTLFWLVNEEWRFLDHKMVKIIAGAITFLIMGLVWYFVIRNFMPF